MRDHSRCCYMWTSLITICAAAHSFRTGAFRADGETRSAKLNASEVRHRPAWERADSAFSGEARRQGVWPGLLTNAGTAPVPLCRCYCWKLGPKIWHALIFRNLWASAPGA